METLPAGQLTLPNMRGHAEIAYLIGEVQTHVSHILAKLNALTRQPLPQGGSHGLGNLLERPPSGGRNRAWTEEACGAVSAIGW